MNVVIMNNEILGDECIEGVLTLINLLHSSYQYSQKYINNVTDEIISKNRTNKTLIANEF